MYRSYLCNVHNSNYKIRNCMLSFFFAHIKIQLYYSILLYCPIVDIPMHFTGFRNSGRYALRCSTWPHNSTSHSCVSLHSEFSLCSCRISSESILSFSSTDDNSNSFEPSSASDGLFGSYDSSSESSRMSSSSPPLCGVS
jgi:hypothetical protein